MAFLNIAPTGTVLPFAGSTAPEGWLLCNGSSQSTTTYAKLFAVIGYTYGGTGGSFSLPDMQGVFPRGAGTNLTNNYGSVTGHTPAGGALATKGGQKTARNGLTFTGGALGGTTAFTVGHSHNLGNAAGARIAFVGNSGAGFTDLYGDFNGPSAAINKVGDNSGGSSNSSASTRNSAGLTGSTDAQNTTSSVTFTAATLTTASGDETTPAFLALNYIIKA
jgi:hypothetical protein